jgi:ABC-type polysaccharide/polyol phosphate transport system ATPase subunit
MIRIILEDAGLTFRFRKRGIVSLKEFLLHPMRHASASATVHIQTLQHIDLDLTEGDRVGIIGHNGAGKSSLLRLLAGVYPPTSGRRTVHGKISSLFDVVLGFDMHSSGWKNIDLRSFLQGETPRTIAAKRDAIVEFSQLEPAMLDMPLKCYSTGMIVRLGFAVATAINPEILIVDEILGAGDLSFQQRAQARMREMMQTARIVIIASHDLGSLRQLCDRVLWLDHGRVRAFGPADEVVEGYQRAYSPPSAAAA